jgi:NitT/TauT family transport system substrate-binding protein
MKPTSLSLPTTLQLILISFLLAMSGNGFADDLPILKLGVLQFGTVNWELDVIKRHGLDKKYGIDLQITPLGGKSATHTALQGKSVDVIVSDWIWVSRQRSQGRDYTLSPYSTAAGSVMVNAGSGITNLAGLKGKKLGIAGGPLDKTWLLLRAYDQKLHGTDLMETLDAKFAAPPLLNKLAIRGDLDGAINFWHYTARLKAAGFKSVLDMPEILATLGIQRQIPLIGWVFSESWANQHIKSIKALLRASQDAKKILLHSDQEWDSLRPLMKAQNDDIFKALRDGFRSAVATCFGEQEMAAARKTFSVLAQIGGAALTGDSRSLQAGTFWPGFSLGACE